MAYTNEKASKINHQYIIENQKIKDYLLLCDKVESHIPLEIDSNNARIELNTITDKIQTSIERVITIDGGYQEVNINDKFPSQKLCYYSVGIITFSIKDLEELEETKTINPDDIGKLENLERFTFVVPMQNIRLKEKDFTTTIRETLFEVFRDNSLSGDSNKHKDSLINTIKWLVFKEYSDSNGSISFACPKCQAMQTFTKQTSNYKDEKNNFCKCDKCDNIIYITDCFDLHTLVDEINGATLIESYIMSVFEIILMLSVFRFFFENNATQWLTKILFIKDGPLALFSRLDDFAFKVVRPFMQFLYEKSLQDNKSYANVVGLDKSGMFVEHFANIEDKIPQESITLPNLDYMRKYITGNNESVFGQNTYFGIKMFVKKDKNLSFILDVSVPFGEETHYKDYIKNPSIHDFLSLAAMLRILFKLKCDLYAKSFIPIAMINKLVSLSNTPSKKILTIFSKDMMS